MIHPFTKDKVQIWIGEYVLAGYGSGGGHGGSLWGPKRLGFYNSFWIRHYQHF